MKVACGIVFQRGQMAVKRLLTMLTDANHDPGDCRGPERDMEVLNKSLRVTERKDHI